MHKNYIVFARKNKNKNLISGNHALLGYVSFG